jgi:hypothetical protein
MRNISLFPKMQNIVESLYTSKFGPVVDVLLSAAVVYLEDFCETLSAPKNLETWML